MSDQQLNTTKLKEQSINRYLLHEEEVEHRRGIVYLDERQQQQQRPALAQRPYSSMSKNEKDAEKKKYEQMKSASTFVSAQDMEKPYIKHLLSETKKINGQKMTGEELMNLALAGDCSMLEKLDPVLRNRAATLYMARFVNLYGENFTPEAIVASMKQNPEYVKEMLNPLLRAGISLFIHSTVVEEAVVEKYRKLDALFNQEIMVATLTKNKSTVPDDFTETEKWKNIRSQQFMIKSLLAAHVGQLTEKNHNINAPERPWQGPVANAFAHCSRVVYTLPGTQDYSETATTEVVSSLVGLAPFKKRFGATHNLQLKRRDGTKEAKEKKSFTPFNQQGMNVAIGGLGNVGIPGPGGEVRQLRNDGSCGHLYMHLEKGDKEKNPGMLIGFESDAFMVRNQQGHRHDIFATAEKASSFGGQRVDEIGDKYGGREVDLSQVSEKGFTQLMDFVDELTDHLLSNGDDQSVQWLEQIARAVSGELMSRSDLQDLIDDMKRMAEEYLMINPYKNVDFIGDLYGH